MRKFLFLLATLLIAAGISIAQTGSSSSSSNTSGTSAQSSGTTGSNTGAANTQSDQTNATPSSSTADQNSAADNTGTAVKSKKGNRLPQTASPLPFLGLLGTSLAGVGFTIRRKLSRLG